MLLLLEQQHTDRKTGQTNIKHHYTMECNETWKQITKYLREWLVSRVVSELDSGAEGPGLMAVAMLSGNSLRQTIHVHCAYVHQAAKLVAALSRVARVTAGLAESNGSLVYDSRHRQAACQEPGSDPEPYAR